ncbi:hypothetical protein TTHERM_00006090 (macronuclear) [Tetrahymena thermophila SB210]|uniref:Uncharacterized protein n=1 Tax=Tetrahymena thermophila (strain SB210) TaxID=312017 RepID=Q22SC7_TETTS|nr:hypothetical protein TTHERM_00006090 [Tetrahymena thermophila SB210]EAR87845.1 hypothetical protein TTHERM_00006090 [Tetrahymena thermophila SB210]|eukprot:XP_001008090.1 hypothetical protein TTHERM_00006090 [Tetrahymena thermophila SB210]
MSDTENQPEDQQLYEQEEQDDDEGVVIENHSAQNSSQHQNNSQEENRRYQEHLEEKDEENNIEDFIPDIDQNEEQEEKVVRAQNQPVKSLTSFGSQKLKQQASNPSQNDQAKEVQRQPSAQEEMQSSQQQGIQQSQQIQRQTSNHQQKLQEEQQNYQQQQQKQQIQRSQSQQDQILFSQFLNEILDQYRTVQRAFKAIDRHNKGFIELNDLAIEIAARFGIENESQQKEIFVKLGHGNSRINRELFEEAFHDIVQDRQIQQQQLFSSMNVVTQSYDPTHSPFKDKQEREEIINIFASNKNVNLDEANKVEHFTEDSMYAPVIRRLRQQPNFNEFVRSYNNLQFPKLNQQKQKGEVSYQPFSQLHSLPFNANAASISQQQFLMRHELFQNTSSSRNYRGAQSLLDEYRQSAPQNQNFAQNSGSPLRQLKISTHTFSPNRYYKILDSPKEFAFERKFNSNNNNYQTLGQAPQNPQIRVNPGGRRFLSPQYARRPNQTFLGFEFGTQNYQSQLFGNQMKQSQGNFMYKPKRNNLSNSKLFASQEINLNKDTDFLHRSTYLASPKQSAQTYGSGNPLFQSLSFGGNMQQYNNNIFSGIDNPLNQNAMSQSAYAGQRIDLRLSPNQNRLGKLKRNVNLGLENISQLNRQNRLDVPSNLNQTTSFNSAPRNIKDQLNQYLSQLGSSNYSINTKAQPSPQRYRPNNSKNSKTTAAYPLDDETDRFGDILSRLGGTGQGRSNNRSLERRRNNRNFNLDILGGTMSGGANASPFKKSQSPTQFNLSPSGPKGGVVGQMQRVKQIQASLRALPNKQKVKFSRPSNSKNNNYYN